MAHHRRLGAVRAHLCGAGEQPLAPLELRGRPLRVDEVMMGCAFIAQQDEANATVAAALEAGIDWFDTAAAYGESEVQLGEALAAAGASDTATVITKVRGDPGSEPRFEQEDQSAAAASHTNTVSKDRMGLKKIHTIRFHDATDERIDEALKPDGLLAGLRALRAAGELDAVSLGMCVREEDPASAELVLRLIREAPAGTFDSAMLAYGWNLENQSSLPILLECQKRGIDVHPAGCFFFRGYGILFDPSKTDDEELLAKRAQWVALADKHNVGLASVAVGFASLPAVIKKVVLGMVRRLPAHLPTSTVCSADGTLGAGVAGGGGAEPRVGRGASAARALGGGEGARPHPRRDPHPLTALEMAPGLGW